MSYIENDLNNNDLFVIGIGASAGGLNALKNFFNHIPSNFNHCFIIVQHLSPDYKSKMVQLLAKNTKIPIREAKNFDVPEPNQIYIIPSNKDVTIEDGKLILTTKLKRSNAASLPINAFFDSLGNDYGKKSIGIILSGTGTDGSKGVLDININGGLVMAQDPNEADFNGMPNSTIATGTVDHINTTEGIAKYLLNYIDSNGDLKNKAYVSVEKSIELKYIINQLKNEIQVNFSSYKKATLIRGVLRRMHINAKKDITSYYNYTKNNEEELYKLIGVFAIGVTKFFRDPSMYAYLNRYIIPDLFEGKKEEDIIKIWVVGCSTGEEAYSLAILLHDYKEKIKSNVVIKIFATDINQKSLQTASKGVFDSNIENQIKKTLLNQHFKRSGDTYKAQPHIRQMIIFSKQNILENQPLVNVDLVSCRNLLIYYNTDAQRKILNNLHFSIKKDAYMILGLSESKLNYDKTGKFSVKSKKWKIYQNLKPIKYTNKGQEYIMPLKSVDNKQKTKPSLNNKEKMSEILANTILQEFKAASAYVDKNFNLISADGDLREYFNIPKFSIRTFSILDILPVEVANAVSNSLRKVNNDKDKIVVKGINYINENTNGKKNINITCKFLKKSHYSDEDIYLIIFYENNLNFEEKSNYTDTSDFKINYDKLKILEEEIAEKNKELKDLNVIVETSNEKLQSANQELMASNEELQSTNEELQSLNEELHSINAEHQDNITEIITLNEDLENLISNTNIATIFLDEDLKIRKFTPAVLEIFSLLDSDIGRPLDHFNILFGEENRKLFEISIRQVMKSGKAVEKEIIIGDKWYIKSTNPYFITNNKIGGSVITFVEISKIKNLQKELSLSNKFLKNITTLAPTIIYIYNHQTNSNEYATKELLELLGFTREKIESLGAELLPSLIYPEDLPKVLEHLNTISNGNLGVVYEIEYRIKDSNEKIHWLYSKDTIYEKIPGTNFVKHIGIALDITEQKNNEQKLQDSNIMFNAIVDGSMAGYWDWYIKDNYEYMSPTFKKMFGFEDHEVPNRPEWWQKQIHPDDLDGVFELFNKHVKSKGKVPFNNEVRYFHKNGSIVWVSCIGKVIEWNKNGEPIRMVGSHIDITDLKNTQLQLTEVNKKLKTNFNDTIKELKQAEERYENLYDFAPDMLFSIEPKKGKILECNKVFLQKMGYTKSQILKMNIFNLFHQESKEKVKLAFQLFKDEGEIHQAELSLISKRKKKIDILLNLKAIRDDKDKIKVGSAIARDVSELKEVITDLEELTYVTTHDLKAPLNNISMFLNLLKEDVDISDNSTKEAISWIEKNVNKAELTLKNLLSVTKARSLVLEDMSLVNLEEAISEAKDNLDINILKNCKITYDLSKCNAINFSRMHLVSMIQNLIDNAIKYSKPDIKPEIHIETTFNNSFYCIAVKDNGIGIDLREHKDRVFGLFKRANDDTKGSGLALYIIKKVLEKTGGKIEVESKLGEGSTFYLYFKK